MFLTHRWLLIFVQCLIAQTLTAQDTSLVLRKRLFTPPGYYELHNQPGWRFQAGHNLAWADPAFDDSQWPRISPDSLLSSEANKKDIVEGCFRLKISVDSSLAQEALYLRIYHYASVRVFINGQELLAHDDTGHFKPLFQPDYANALPHVIKLDTNSLNTIVVYVKDQNLSWVRNYTYTRLRSPFLIVVGNGTYKALWTRIIQQYEVTQSATVTGLVLLTLLFWLLVKLNPNERPLLWIALITSFMALDRIINGFDKDSISLLTYSLYIILWDVLNLIWVAMIPIVVSQIILNRTTTIANWFFLTAVSLRCLVSYFSGIASVYAITFYIGVTFSVFIIGYVSLLIVKYRAQLDRAQWVVIIGLLISFIAGFTSVVIQLRYDWQYLFYMSILTFLTFPVSLLVYIALRLKEQFTTIQKNALDITRLSEEKQQLLTHQNELLEQQVEARTAELRASQDQLIQKEKLASLGELTAGIAHEIQNPLNFVNNFSEVSTELVDELKEELAKGEIEEAGFIADDLHQNLQKITHHGHRAGAIVRGMLEHARTSTGERTPTNLNALAEEYLRLAYHGLKAKQKSFDCQLITDFAPDLPMVNVVAQDIGRVLLNLYNNAFYAVQEKQKQAKDGYQPTIWVSTRLSGGTTATRATTLELRVRDNGTGIPDAVKAKIFQPFFTTKPTGEGTGLGLSLSYDIVTKGHGGRLEVDSYEGEGTTFMIALPTNL